MWEGLTRTLLILTFVTGILDAVSFIALGQVFVAMQTALAAVEPGTFTAYLLIGILAAVAHARTVAAAA